MPQIVGMLAYGKEVAKAGDRFSLIGLGSDKRDLPDQQYLMYYCDSVERICHTGHTWLDNKHVL